MLSPGNTINNNFNIVNNIINYEKPISPNQLLQSARGSGIANTQQETSMPFEESIIQTIVTKLGYTADEVRKHVRDESSFVSVLYHKIKEEQSKANLSRSNNSLSAKSGVYPSFVPSITSTLNQSNISTNTWN